MIEDFDLIIYERERRLCALRLPISLSNKIFDEKIAQVQGISYSRLKPLGDWLAVCDAPGVLVGVQIMIYVDLGILDSTFFQAQNVSRDGEDFRILFAEAINPQMDGWPMTTVYSLKSDAGEPVLYIPEFYSARQSASLAKDFT